MHALQSVIISPMHTQPSDKLLQPPPIIQQSYNATSKFTSTTIQFPGKKLHNITFQLPPYPKEIGLSLGFDEHFQIPYLKRVLPGSIAYDHIPPGLRRNYFIVSINNESPITPGFAVEYMQK